MQKHNKEYRFSVKNKSKIVNAFKWISGIIYFINVIRINKIDISNLCFLNIKNIIIIASPYHP